jgi:MFS family permease
MPGAADRRSMRGLDLVALSIAGVQTGWGPFVAAFLTANKWTQGDIGLALSVGTFTGILSQLPAGTLVDRMRHKKTACAIATCIISAGALLIAILPQQLFVLVAEVGHGFASCMLTPGIAAISLILIGDAAVGERLGRNARFAAIGNGASAAIMGLSGKLLPEASVFWLAAALGLPALYALRMIRLPAVAPSVTQPAQASLRSALPVLLDRRLVIFAVCGVLFFLANAAMLPLAASEVTMRASHDANAIIAACIVVPQVIVAVLSPLVGRAAERFGRRPILLLGFAALPLRGALLAFAGTPALLVPIQALDGVSAAVFGVMLPLVVADVTRRSGHFNLAMSAVGLAAGLGATVSTLAAGQVADAFGSSAAFAGLTLCGVAAAGLVWGLMPETRQATERRAMRIART